MDLYEKHVRTNFLIESVECYKDTKAYDITKLTAELKCKKINHIHAAAATAEIR